MKKNYLSDNSNKNQKITMKVMDLSIILVNWNSGDLLAKCIISIQNSLGYSKDIWAIVVVDNGSSDDSLEKIKNIDDVHLLLAENNLGFGSACNLGVAALRSEYILFLNPDATVYESSISSALEYMRDPVNKSTGICGVQLKDDLGDIAHSCSRFPSAANFISHTIGLDRLFPRVGHFMNEWPHDQTCKVDHVIGAFFLVRSQLFDLLGGFDDRFFLYLEDLDFSYRASRLGWDSIYLANVKAHHSGGGVSRQIMARRLFYSLRSSIVYSFKHFSLIEAIAVLFSITVLEFISRIFYSILRRSLVGINETIKAYVMLWRWLPSWIFFGVTR